jgi:hypothetical protein
VSERSFPVNERGVRVRHRAGGSRPRVGRFARLFFGGWFGRSRGVTAAGGAIASGRVGDPSQWGGCGRGAIAAFGAVATVLALCGCESTQERSTELQRVAKHDVLATRGVSVTKENPSVRVLQSTVVHSGESTAVVVALRNTSSHALENAPIEVTVRDAHGAVLYQNNSSDLEPSLTTVSLLQPAQETIWVDDQVTASGTPASASALVGEATPRSGPIPRLSVAGTHLGAEAGAEATLSGTVENHSQTTQQNLVVYALARRASKIVAAGRAVIPEVTATTNASTNAPFQIYFVGNPSGAQIQTSAPATTF